jgi:Na+/glutamate symporter
MMTPAANSLVVPDFLTFTLGLLVYFVGVIVTQRVAFLHKYNIPEPVTGGFLAAIAVWAFYAATGLAVDFEMVARDSCWSFSSQRSASIPDCPICLPADERWPSCAC